MHIPVLLQEIQRGLQIQKGSIVLDATVGGGGYTQAFCEAVGSEGIVIGLDQDNTALENVRKILFPPACTLYLINSNFRDLDTVLRDLNIKNIDAIVFDLGLSSLQLEESGRGFSFLRDEPLWMTFSEDPEKQIFTALDIVNSWEESVLADVLYGYGEERFSRKIAKGIVEYRKHQRIETTTQLVDIIKNVVPEGYTKLPTHSATRTFQALRIAVNDELRTLSEGLKKGYEALKKEGRMAVVSFHSLEDRIVKNFYKEKKQEGSTILTKKPIVPTKLESRQNPRSRSAKLRILEK